MRMLMLQGPTNALFALVARGLRDRGHEAWRINVSLGDRLFWRGPGAVDFRGSLAEWPAFVGRFMDERAVTDLLLLGEKRPYHAPAIAAARERGIEVTVTDFGYLRPDWVAVERDGLNGGSRFPRDPAVIRARAAGLPAVDRAVRYPHRPLNQALWDMAFHLSSAFDALAFPHFRRHTLRHPAVNYLATGWRLARRGLEEALARRTVAGIAGPYWLFAMQMEDDYSLRAYSRYADLDGAMREAVASFARHAPREASLLFKLHPLDPGLKRWRSRLAAMAREAGAAGRVRFIDGGDPAALVAGSRGVVTVNSTVGLLAIERGRPLAVLGETICRVPGLAFEGPLDDFWTKAAPPDPAFAQAALRLVAASLHVRGGMYDAAGIEAAAQGIVHRLHHGLVNEPIAEVLSGAALPEPRRAA